MKRANTLQVISYTVSLLLISLGLSILLEWAVCFPQETSTVSSSCPISYSLALALIMSGLAIALLLLKRKNATKILGFIIISIGFLSTIDWMIGPNQLSFLSQNHTLNTPSSPLITNTILLLIGLFFLSQAVNSKHTTNRRIRRGIINLIFLSGTFSLSLYFFTNSEELSFFGFKTLSPHIALSFILLSIAMLSIFTLNVENKTELKTPIKNQITFQLLLSALFLFSVSSITSINKQKRNIETNLAHQLTEESYLLSQNINKKLNNVENLSQTLARGIYKNEDSKTIANYLQEELNKQDSSILTISTTLNPLKDNTSTTPILLRITKQQENDTSPSSSTSIEPKYLENPNTEETEQAFWTMPFNSKVHAKTISTYCIPITTPTLNGTLSIEVDLKSVLPSTSSYHHSYSTIANGEITTLISPPMLTDLSVFSIEANIQALNAASKSHIKGTITLPNTSNNTNTVFYYTPVHNANWIALVGVNEDTTRQTVNHEMSTFIWFFALAYLTSFIGIILLYLKVTNPIKEDN